MSTFAANRALSKCQKFSPVQENGAIELSSGKVMVWNTFRNDFKVTQALIGDSLIRDICVNGACTYSISGGTVADFLADDVLQQLGYYETIIVASVGGNDLVDKDGYASECHKKVHAAFEVLLDKFAGVAKEVLVMTICQRHGGHKSITNFNGLVLTSARKTGNTRKKVYALDCWQADKVHLTPKGKRDFCKAISALRKKYGLVLKSN